MAYETRLQGVSGDKISGGWHPWPIFAPLPTSINYIYTRCLKLTPDSPIHFTRIPLYPYLSGRMLPVIFAACLLPLEYRGEIGFYGFVIESIHPLLVSFSSHFLLSSPMFYQRFIEWFQRYIFSSRYSLEDVSFSLVYFLRRLDLFRKRCQCKMYMMNLES